MLGVNVRGVPAYDLPTVMTKMLVLGMSLHDVIRATTITPATVIRKQDSIGQLKPVSAHMAALWVESCAAGTSGRRHCL